MEIFKKYRSPALAACDAGNLPAGSVTVNAWDVSVQGSAAYECSMLFGCRHGALAFVELRLVFRLHLTMTDMYSAEREAHVSNARVSTGISLYSGKFIWCIVNTAR
jgi:hypothetical protein